MATAGLLRDVAVDALYLGLVHLQPLPTLQQTGELCRQDAGGRKGAEQLAVHATGREAGLGDAIEGSGNLRAQAVVAGEALATDGAVPAARDLEGQRAQEAKLEDGARGHHLSRRG